MHLATLGYLGLDQEARLLSARLLALEPNFSIEDAIRRSPMTRGEDLARYAEGLRRAGLPESAQPGPSPNVASVSPKTPCAAGGLMADPD